jgi:hypothetical protein
MRRLFRLSILVVLLAALVLGAAALGLWPWPGDSLPRPEAVPSGDREVAWLYSATSASTWERFVTAAQNAAARPDLGLSVDSSRAFPPQTTAVPEVALSVRGGSGRLLLRWYKLTSDWKTDKWVQALGRRQPPPLAVIGGSSSDPAIELAKCLQGQFAGSADPGSTPLLLLTTATADEDARPDGSSVGLTDLYPGRSYRFCFTNRQMAEAATDFVWSHDALRPDGDTYYLVPWKDDAYSMDLAARFIDTLEPRLVARNVARAVAWQAGCAALGGVPHLDGGPERWGSHGLSEWQPIDFGVGTFDQPNRWEALIAQRIMAKRRTDPAGHSVLVLSAASAQPARRFLRGLMRLAPLQAQRFVVVTGDAIAFNTIYRDRNVAWPVQDLPFDLVLFCHRNPAEAAAGFQPEGDAVPTARTAADGHGDTGTEDVLLFGDIVEALVQATFEGGGLPASADELGARLRGIHWHPAERRVGPGSEGFPLFSEHGNRHSGTGEHVVWLRPQVEHGNIQPRATITVWFLEPEESTEPVQHPRPGRTGRWQPSRDPLSVDYETMNN